MKALDICDGEELPDYLRGDNLELLLQEIDMVVMYTFANLVRNKELAGRRGSQPTLMRLYFFIECIVLEY